jgi:DNA topoisomerase III
MTAPYGRAGPAMGVNPLPKYTLIISEKPSVARAIAACLGTPQKHDGYLQVDSYLVTWALGHLMELYDAEDYNRRYKKWSLDTLPIIPDRFRLKVRDESGARRQYDAIRSLVQRKDVTRIINACDAGREGELIFRYLYHHMEAEQPVERLWLSSVVPADIRSALTQLRPEADYDRLAAAASARSESDWLVGINATRAYTVRCSTLLQLGRVQTPTLALIVQREKEILQFETRDFWEIPAELVSEEKAYSGLWTGPDGTRLYERDAAQAIVRKTRGQTGTITRVESKETRELPPLLYNLTDLQKDANRRYGYTAQKTLQIAQTLYEQRRLITYPRTDSHHLNQQVYRQADATLLALGKGPFAPLLAQIPTPRASHGRRVVDDSKVTDHHAIIPTAHSRHGRSLSDEEVRIFRLIVVRYLGVFCHPARYREMQVDTLIAGETVCIQRKNASPFRLAQSAHAQNRMTDSRRSAHRCLCRANCGKSLAQAVKAKHPKKARTKPPPRYTEGSLLGAMETAGKELTEDALKEVMKDKGIGTVASRPQIIEKLKGAGYITLQKRLLHPTEKGIQLIDILPSRQLTSPELTGEWEYRLRQIERGEDRKSDFMAAIRAFTESLVQDARTMVLTAQAPALQTVGSCPTCGGRVLENKKAFSCSDCSLIIWKKIAGKTITPTQVRRLLSGGRVGPLKGFRSKTGKSFSAALVLQDGKVTFDFAPKERK